MQQFPYLLAKFYVGDAAFDGPADRSSTLMEIILERGPVCRYFAEPAKSLFICDSYTQEETTKQRLGNLVSG